MNSNEIFDYAKENHSITELLEHPDFSHTRYRKPWTSSPEDPGSVMVYFHCSDSPSGVLMAGGCFLTEENRKVLASKNIQANTGPSRGQIACSHGWGRISF